MCRFHSLGLKWFVFVLLLQGSLWAYRELVPNYDPIHSPVSIRILESSTLADLDYSAYSQSPMRYNPEIPQLHTSHIPITIGDLRFEIFDKIVFDKQNVDLSPRDLKHPMSWLALKNRIYVQFRDESLDPLLQKVAAEKWGDSAVYQSFQTVEDLWIHHRGKQRELWAKVVLASWFKPHGIPHEFYARLDMRLWLSSKRDSILDWIENSYQKTPLNREEVKQWGQVLASYWYPTLNTDLLPLSDRWPENDTEKDILQFLNSIQIQSPIVVMRGNPRGQVRYQIFAIQGWKNASNSKAVKNQGKVVKDQDQSPSPLASENQKRWQSEFQDPVLAQNISKVRQATQNWLKSVPNEQWALKDSSGLLHFRRELDYLLADSISKQSPEQNPLPHLLALKKRLDSLHINLLIVPIPPKSEIYYDRIPGLSGLSTDLPIAKGGRLFFQELQGMGLDILDLTPAFLNSKASDENEHELLYQKNDTHWSYRGFLIAADAIYQRIQKYSWFDQIPGDRSLFQMNPVRLTRMGDLVERLPIEQQNGIDPDTLSANQFSFKGKLNLPFKGAPILLMGDSFTGVFESIDCRSAGLASHLAYALGQPIDLITSWGGGPILPERLWKVRSQELASTTRLVIYVMTARDFWHDPQGWQ